MAIKQIPYEPTKNEFGAFFAQRPRPKPKPKPKKALSYRDKLTFLLEGNEHSGNYGHVGRPGQQGGSGPSSGVPKEPGTTPIPKGKIRGYHYTEDMDAVEREGLDVTKAKGSTYGEPNAIWFSTEKPGDFKHYVEVFLDPEELGVGRPSMVVKRPDGWKNAETPEEKQEALDEYNRGNHNFTTFPKQIKPDRFVTTHRPWHHHYRYLTKDPKQVAAIVAGEYDWGLDDPEYAPAIRQIKAEAKKSLSDLFSLYGTDKSGNRGHKGRPGQVGGSAPDGEENAEDDPYALAPGAPRGGEGQGMLFEYAPESGSEGALRAEAEKVTATMDAMLPEAVQNADYNGLEAAEWDDLDHYMQASIKEKWADNSMSDSYVGEAGAEAGKEYIDDHLTPDAIFDNVVEDKGFREMLEEEGIDLQSITFTTPDVQSDRLYMEIDRNEIRDKDGKPLADDDERLGLVGSAFIRLARGAKWDVQAELEGSDGYSEAVREAEDRVLADEWSNMSDESRFQVAIDYGMVPKTEVEHEAPGEWKFDGDSSDEDYVQTRAVALELTHARTADLMTQRGLDGTARARELAEKVSEEFWHAWKSSSTSPLGVGMQIAVAQEMGVHSSPLITDQQRVLARDAMIRQFTTPEEQELFHRSSRSLLEEGDSLTPGPARDKFWADAEAAEKTGPHELERLAMGRAQAYVRAQWETTQYVMQQAGVEEVNLYRGIILNKDEVIAARAPGAPSGNPDTDERYRVVIGPLPNLHLLQNSVASSTTKSEVANSWNGIGEKTLADPNNRRAVVRFRAPATALFSLPVFGQNIHEESEVVLMGTKGLEWDAFERIAPTFETTPIPMPTTTGRVVIVEPEVKGLRVTWQLAMPPPRKAVVVDLSRNVDGHWLVGWRPHKDHPLPKKRAVPMPHTRTSDALAQVIVRGMKKGMLPTLRKLSAYREKLLFLLEGNEHSGNYGHEGRPGQVGGSAPSKGQEIANTTRKPYDDGQRIYLPSSATILRGVNSGVNAKIQIEKALQDHEAATGERPTPEQLKATEEALRALPFLHSTSVAGALGALDNGLMSHAEMDKHRLKFETAANALEDELKDLMGPGRTKDELVPNPYERRTPYSPQEVQEKLGLSEADATTVVEKVAELRALRTVLMGTTNEADEYLGLDGFVFMTHGRQLPAYGTVAVVVDNAVFNQPGSFATKDDIAHLPGAFNQDGGYPAPVIAQYKDQIVTGDDYYRVAAARAGEPYRIPQRAAVQLDEIKTPRVPKEAVKGFVVTGSLAEAQQLAAKLKERGLTGKVLYIDSDTAVDTALQQEQLRSMQTTGQWDPAIVTRAQNKMGKPNPPRTMILRRDS